MSSKVYYTDFHTTVDEPLTKKLARLILTAGMDQIDFQGKFVAIKMHFGEPGNLAFLRPNYARVVADVVKDLGGSPSSRTATRCTLADGRTPWIIWTVPIKTDLCHTPLVAR